MCDEYPHSVTRNAQVPPRGVTDHVTVPFIQTTLAVPPPPPRGFPVAVASDMAYPLRVQMQRDDWPLRLASHGPSTTCHTDASSPSHRCARPPSVGQFYWPMVDTMSSRPTRLYRRCTSPWPPMELESPPRSLEHGRSSGPKVASPPLHHLPCRRRFSRAFLPSW